MSEVSKWDDKRTERQVAISKSLWQDPEYRKKVIDGVKDYWTEERRKEKSEQMKKRALEQRERRNGNKNTATNE
jgi:hypothetical protein